MTIKQLIKTLMDCDLDEEINIVLDADETNFIRYDIDYISIVGNTIYITEKEN